MTSSDREELLTEHNIWRSDNAVHKRDNMHLCPGTIHGLDEALTPLTQAVHMALFNLRSAGTVVQITGRSLQSQTFESLRNAAKVFADLESTRPANRGHNDVMKQTLSSFDDISKAVANLGDAREKIEESLQTIARAIDGLVDAVQRRRFEVFEQAILDSAVRVDSVNVCTDEPCYLCLEPVPANNAAWISGPPCQCTTPVLSCRPCLTQAIFQMAESGRKTYGRCPHCRSEFTWQDVCTTAPKTQ